MHIVQVLDEAAAVLVGYRVGLSQERVERGLLGNPEEGNAGEVEKRDKKVAVLDMGETSLAISVVNVSEGEYTVLGKGRDDKLGGREFDNLVRGVARLQRNTCSCAAAEALCQGVHEEDQGRPRPAVLGGCLAGRQASRGQAPTRR